ncbi:MAG TPA: hypothetical protein VNZ52_07080 [Candidatus Thermoplasmatota archaeon]|nr:hypothetical protein [Candidatus Thermoplasmatota archaeon]
MTLLEVQQAYARLLADPSARRRFAENPGFFLEALGFLTAAEVAALSQLPLARLEAAGKRLEESRLRTLAAHAPWTMEALGTEGARRAVSHFAEAFPSREETTLREAARFLRWIGPRVRKVGPGTAPWLSDAAAYERAVVRLQLAPERDPDAYPGLGLPRLDPSAVTLVLKHDLSSRAKGALGAPPRVLSGFVFHRPARTRGVRVYRVEPWFAEALGLADGTRPLGEVLSGLQGRAPSKDAVLAALREAERLGVLWGSGAPAPTS